MREPPPHEPNVTSDRPNPETRNPKPSTLNPQPVRAQMGGGAQLRDRPDLHLRFLHGAPPVSLKNCKPVFPIDFHGTAFNSVPLLSGSGRRGEDGPKCVAAL